MKPHLDCPIQGTSNVVAGKWKTIIVWRLAHGGRRFAALRDSLPGISDKVLTSQLRDLVRDGVVVREVGGEVPPQVAYSLSAAGKALVPVLESMALWGVHHLGIGPNPLFTEPECAAIIGAPDAG